MPPTDSASLYGFHRQKRLRGDKEISSNTSLSFASQLGSLINTSPSSTSSRPKSRISKSDIFRSHNLNTAKRAKRDEVDSPAFEQKHTTNGETLERGVWERSKRKMEAKAKLYAAMKRGDVEDEEGKYGVDFDRKWAEGGGGADAEEEEDDDVEDDEVEDDEGNEVIEYIDEFGRTRQGTRSQAAQVARQARGLEDMKGDRFTARPLAPSNILYGDAIQHQAFNPDAKIEEQMAELAKKRDRSLTPPPELHFDADAEVRTKGTGFFQFSGDAEERGKQMDDLEKTREDTERIRAKRKAEEGERRKMEADDFLDQMAAKLDASGPRSSRDSVPAQPEEAACTVDVESKINPTEPRKKGVEAMDAMERIEAALAREAVD
ncbi:hypothetical protein LTR95_005120 [Oleoguttula sp. CCFEE 5521]